MYNHIIEDNMKRLAKLLPIAAAILLMCIPAHDVSAQQTDDTHRSYIYCCVYFGSFKEIKTEKINAYTKTLGKEWKVTMSVDYGQYDDDFIPPLTDSDGNVRLFNSQVAALNWLGMHGWELISQEHSMMNGDSRNHRTYLRLDVTGLSYEEINGHLSLFSNEKYNLNTTDQVKHQQADGMY